jgi:hypothetical protein
MKNKESTYICIYAFKYYDFFIMIFQGHLNNKYYNHESVKKKFQKNHAIDLLFLKRERDFEKVSDRPALFIVRA